MRDDRIARRSSRRFFVCGGRNIQAPCQADPLHIFAVFREGLTRKILPSRQGSVARYSRANVQHRLRLVQGGGQ